MEDEANGTTQTQEPNGDGRETDWKAESRKWEKQSKENYKAMTDLKAAAAASEEKIATLTASLDAARHELDGMKAERDAAKWREDASKETGVPSELLRGSTADEVMEHAKSLQPYFKKHSAPFVGSEGGSPAQQQMSPRDEFAQAMEQIFK